MNQRIRMARKRLMVARERLWAATMAIEGAAAMHDEDFWVIVALAEKEYRREMTLRAIERRKEKLT